MGVAERQQRDFRRREQDILAAAYDLFTETDWDQVTIAQIAERAEIGKGTVYKHFSCKDDIFARIILENRRQFFWDEKKAVAATDSAVDQLRAIVRSTWQHFLTEPEFHRKLFEYGDLEVAMCRCSGAICDELASTQQAAMELYQGVLQLGIEQGVFKVDNLERAMVLCGSTIKGAIRMATCHEEMFESLRDDAFADHLAQFVLRGLGYTDA